MALGLMAGLGLPGGWDNMTSAWVGAWAAIGASAVAVISAFFAFLSLHVSRKTFKMGAATTGTMELALRADEFFANRPELRPYFYDRWPAPPGILDPQSSAPRPLTEEDLLRSKLLSASEYFLDILESIWDNVKVLPGDDQDAYREWIHDMLERGAVLRQFLTEFDAWYPTLTELIKSGTCQKPEVHSYVREVQSDVAQDVTLQSVPKHPRAGLTGSLAHRRPVTPGLATSPGSASSADSDH
jgi:hypothetical protein